MAIEQQDLNPLDYNMRRHQQQISESRMNKTDDLKQRYSCTVASLARQRQEHHCVGDVMQFCAKFNAFSRKKKSFENRLRFDEVTSMN